MDSNDVNNIDGLEEENSISEGEENEEDKDELVEDDEVGIQPPQMYVAFANTFSGYQKVGYIRKDTYNQVVRQRRQHSSDASATLKYLQKLHAKDLMMVVSLTVDDENRLQYLFCCDGESQIKFKR
ncbi:hypothetical protein JHK87_042876 [Glycine soja]|nr:hypothetical protein JHK87_042876 [Glycine soja]